MIIVLNAGPTMMDDTDSYHIQMIKWIREFGTIPGLANLHERYGFNSSWFSSISFFLPASNHRNFYTSLNGTISLWFISYLIIRTFANIKGYFNADSIGVFFILILSLLCWPIIRGNAATSNYDFIATVLVVVLFVETYKINERKKNIFLTEWFLYPVFLFTVRIINYPLLLLSIAAIIFLYRIKDFKKIKFLILIGIFLVFPFLFRNVMLSGYPFYPSAQFNLFNVDWKVDSAILSQLMEFIKYFNRVNSMFLDISETKQLPFPTWIKMWYTYLFTYDKLILIPGLLGIFITIILFKRRNLQNKLVNIFLLSIALQLLSWFFIAPDPRFIYGVLLCGSFLLAFYIFKNTSFKINHRFLSFIIISISLSVLIYSISKIYTDRKYHNYMYPYKLPIPKVTKVMVDKIELNIPEKLPGNWNARCYATEVPCLYKVHFKLHARGTELKQGFQLKE